MKEGLVEDKAQHFMGKANKVKASEAG